MNPKGNNNKKDFRKNFRGSRRKGNVTREKIEVNKVTYTCEICTQAIQDITAAIALPVSGNPAHFDCVIKKLAETEKLEEGQQIVYLGGGNFGIVKIDPKSSKNDFKIIKKIEFEDREIIPGWRKELVKVVV
ncbi:MAG: hypothetical protein RBT69_13650 [Spirochaetia bacterium]|jgi:hypothetical protein|nr:hypothetical protein [Spirochaetia bacterium]